MELPPKNDNDDANSGSDAAVGTPKKTRRPKAAAAPRARAKKSSATSTEKSAAAEKAAKPPREARREERVSATPPEPRASAPEPAFQAPAPISQPASPPVQETFRPSTPPERASDDRDRSETRGESDDRPDRDHTPRPESSRQDSSEDHERAEARNEGARHENESGSGDAQAPQSPQSTGGGQSYQPPQGHQGGQGQGGQGQGGQAQGDWQGGGQERGFWKRNRRDKRKRGKFGDRGPWQPSGGGGGQGGGGGGGGVHGAHPAHPPQPRPPEQAPIFGDLPDPARFFNLETVESLAQEISSGPDEPIYLNKLYALNLADLTAFARERGIKFEGAPARRVLLTQIFSYVTANKVALRDHGWIDLTDRGAHGFIVHEHVNYRLYPEDAYLPESFIKRFGLKRGHEVEVLLQAPQGHERTPSVVRIDRVMGLPAEEIANITPFEELVPYYPLKRILLEAIDVHKDVSMRAFDLLVPVGFGQRGLIVAPPRTGKTVLLQNIANSISNNYPESKLILLLIDERPEEVTDFRRHTKGEVVSSTFDEAPESHVHCAEMVGEKARRLVEMGQHVVILLDSITRLARAYNALSSNAGKIMSGGLEATALQKPKRFFGAARNIEGAGSLTILATALIDTGSRMDEVIFEEFKGTGNMELHLDRGLVEKRIFPAINIDRSGTRKEELIYHPEEMQRVYGLRRAMQGIPSVEAMELFLTRLKKSHSNAEFLMSLNR